jgi:hypothetical protein
MIGATLDLKNPDQYGGESSHATAPIYFIMEGTWKGFPQGKMSWNCFLMCTEILNSHENLPFYAFW